MKSKSKSYIVEFPLRASKKDVRTVDARLKAAGSLYNALLGDGFRIVKSMLADPEREAALETYRAIRKSGNEKARKCAAKRLGENDKLHSFTEYQFHALADQHAKTCFIINHLDSNSIQTTATRIFKALKRWQEKGFSKKGKPRFKTWRNAIRSIQGKSKACMTIKLGDEKMPTRFAWNSRSMAKLELPLVLAKHDPQGYEQSALASIEAGDWKFCRILRKNKKGTRKLYLQVILKGDPYIKPKHQALFDQNAGVKVGLDIGPSTIAAVSEDVALLDVFCRDIEDLRGEIARLQRQNQRRLRLLNPNNYDYFDKRIGRHIETRYRVKKGARQWVKSNRYLKLQNHIRELNRKMADKRKYLHECLSNKIIGMGNVVYTEKLSYKAFQKLFGKSVGFRAPSAFMDILSRKASKAGGEVIDINTWTAKLSQYDHVNNTYTKKPLSQRHHWVGGTDKVQRDLYSAFLARCMNTDATQVCQRQAQKAWPSARLALETAMTNLNNDQARGSLPCSLGIEGQRSSSLKSKVANQEAVNDSSLPEIGAIQSLEPSPVAQA